MADYNVGSAANRLAAAQAKRVAAGQVVLDKQKLLADARAALPEKKRISQERAAEADRLNALLARAERSVRELQAQFDAFAPLVEKDAPPAPKATLPPGPEAVPAVAPPKPPEADQP